MLSKIKKLIALITNKNNPDRLKWNLYGRVWREIGKPYWKFLLGGVICTIIAAGAEAFSITLVKKVIDQGFIEKNMNSLVFIGAQVVGAYTVKGTFTYLKALSMTKAGLLGITNLRRHIYKHMVEQPIGYFHGVHTGHVMNYFTSQANAVLGLVTDNIISIVQNVVTIIMMVGLMFWYAPHMTLVLAILVPGIVIPVVFIARKRNVLIRKSYGIEANSLTHITQSIEGMKTIQSFCAEEQECKRMGKIEDERIALSFKSVKLAGLQTPILEIVISFGLFGALMVGGYFITTGSITTGDFTAFLLALTAAYKPAKTLTKVNGGIHAGLIAAELLFSFLDRKSEITDAPDAVELKREPMGVSLSDINFAYNQADGNVLHDINLSVLPGQVCAFVGPSGGGKSTIFNLLDRFYDAQSGNILFNDKEIKRVKLHSLRENIAIVSQDVFLFNGSIADNIKYGTPSATEEEVINAAKAANAHDFISEFPNGYQNNVGERGTLLSGGQKQRIAIARALLKNAPILLLDEATSALDSQSERHIQSALENLMKDRTTFVIAHRLSTIRDADIICVIKHGRIVEQGTDKELLALNGEYQKLKAAQFRDDKEVVPGVN